MFERGAIFAGFEVERPLGRGGMGAVYLARHPRLPRLVAVKVLDRELFVDSTIRARFEREADLAAGLHHSNIVTVYDRGTEHDQPWIAMQYVDGHDASSLDPVTLPPLRAVQIVSDVAAALDYAHGKGILHRDVKPANMLLEHSEDGPPERVLLADFGIARLRDDRSPLTETGTITATLSYASPEQLSNAPLDHRTDQYSLACSLYRLLTGTNPFPGTDPAAVIAGHLQGTPRPPSALRPGLPAAVDAVVLRALAKRPADRFASCAEFAAAAREALEVTRPAAPARDAMTIRHSALTPSETTVRHPVPGKRRQRRRLLAGVGAALVAAVVVALLVAVTREEQSPAVDFGDPADPLTMVRAFPKLLDPGHDATRNRRGFNASCDTVPSSTPQNLEYLGALTGWSAAWNCNPRGGNEPRYAVVAFATADDVRAALEALPPHQQVRDTNSNGNEYETYRWTTSSTVARQDYIVTSFADDPSRRNFLVIPILFRIGDDYPMTTAQFGAWWRTFPLE